MKFLIVCTMCAVMASVVQAAVPDDWPKCPTDDDSCITEAFKYVLQKYYSGVPDLNLVSIDPFRVKSIVLQRTPSSSVSIEARLENVEVLGLKDMKVSSVSGFKADLSGRVLLEAVVPILTLKGHYIVDGHILVLPIVGNGPTEMTMKNVHIKLIFGLKAIEKNGQTYASIEHVKLDLDPEHVHIRLDNLFNGNQALSDSTNAFLNENWTIIFGEMRGNIAKSVALIMKRLVNAFIENRPYAEHFQ